MRILVTGATGFVGQHLLRLLAFKRRSNQVFGTSLNGESAVTNPNIRVITCDLRDQDRLYHLVRDIRPDHVYHLAALSSVKDSFKNARAVYEANFFASLHLLQAVQRSQPSARVLLVSSAHVYGPVTRRDLPITEHHPLAPDSPYAVSKAAADMLGAQFWRSHGLSVIRARPFNHTGPGQAADFVCSDFARQFALIEAGRREPVVTVGNIKAARDFSDVRDVVRAYDLLLRKGRPGDAYNVSSGRAIPLTEVLTVLSSFVSRKIEVRVEQERIRGAEADAVYGSSAKLRRATGWAPQIPFKKTLLDLYGYWTEALATS
jgi:GDP-4-dehydro-6-deoxy-D-mannose reductase